MPTLRCQTLPSALFWPMHIIHVWYMFLQSYFEALLTKHRRWWGVSLRYKVKRFKHIKHIQSLWLCYFGTPTWLCLFNGQLLNIFKIQFFSTLVDYYTCFPFASPLSTGKNINDFSQSQPLIKATPSSWLPSLVARCDSSNVGSLATKMHLGDPPPNTKILIDHDHGPIFFGITMFVLLGITYCILLYIIVLSCFFFESSAYLTRDVDVSSHQYFLQKYPRTSKNQFRTSKIL